MGLGSVLVEMGEMEKCHARDWRVRVVREATNLAVSKISQAAPDTAGTRGCRLEAGRASASSGRRWPSVGVLGPKQQRLRPAAVSALHRE